MSDDAQLSVRLRARRVSRLFRRKALAAPVVRQILKRESASPDGFVVVADLMNWLQSADAAIASADVSVDRLKQLRAQALADEQDAATAARIMRVYAEKWTWGTGRQDMLRAAEMIELSPGEFARNPTAPSFDFSRVGQKGSRDGFLIRSLDALVPQSYPRRDALIRDLLDLIGVTVSSQLVRSTRATGQN